MGSSSTAVIASIAATLASPLLTTIGLIFYETWTGSAVALNLVKCTWGSSLFLLVIAAEYLTDAPPVLPKADVAGWLVFSSILGIVVGDVMWLQSLQMLGTRRVMLLGTLQPLFAMVAGSLLLGQPITATPYTSLGVVVTCAGLALSAVGKPTTDAKEEYAVTAQHAVTVEEMPHAGVADHHAILTVDAAGARMSWRRLIVGALFAAGNVAFDVAGAVITRYHGQQLSTWTINVVRFGSASVLTAAGMACARCFSSLRRDPSPEWTLLPSLRLRGWAKIFLGASIVTFATPALLNFSLFYMSLGAWTALGSLGPVYAVVVLWVLRGEVTPPAGLAGAALAAAGATIVSLSVHRNALGAGA
jgi:drug/metabolite transporter (DMT)-like permease